MLTRFYPFLPVLCPHVSRGTYSYIGDVTYLSTDHLSTPRVGSDSTGSEVWSWDSDAFGVGTPTGTRTVNLRFAGQYFDAESDLHYNWNRYYDPTTGRYITSDPIGLNGGLNTFAYVGANPVMFVDPEGLIRLGPISPQFGPKFGPRNIGPRIGGPRVPVPKNPNDFPTGSSGGAGAGKSFPNTQPPEKLPPCTYCGNQTTTGDKSCPTKFNWDHIFPKSRGGANSDLNKTPSCARCNQSKGNRTPQEWYDAMPPKYPRTLPPEPTLPEIPLPPPIYTPTNPNNGAPSDIPVGVDPEDFA